MTEAPERIWAEPDGDTIIVHNGAENLDDLIATGYLYEYVRKDVDDLAHPVTAAEAEADHLKAAFLRITTTEAFYVAAPEIDPETFARMVYAQAILDGHTLQSANDKAQCEVKQRYPLRALSHEGGE